MTVLVVLLGVVVALLAVLVVGLLRSHADILRALHDLGAGHDPDRDHDHDAGQDHRATVPFRPGPGVPAPRTGAGRVTDVSGLSPTGAAVHIGVGGQPHSTLLAFLSSGCLTCGEFWTAFVEPVDLPGRDTRLVIVTKGPEAESEASVRALAPRRSTTVMSSSAWDDYEVPVSPYFILVDGPSASVRGEGAAASWGQVRDLLSRALADAGLAPDPPAPSRRSTGRRGRYERHEHVDTELLAAGIGPGHPSLHPEPEPNDGADPGAPAP